ncbi:hypothetical protein JCM16303_002192 [Sporobolomyces ruberrimus]
MGTSHRLLLIVLPILSISLAVLQPRISLFGIFRSPSPPLNLDQCRTIKGLEACEDAWIDHEKGLAYLACSTQQVRKNWAPALGSLRATPLPSTSPDTLKIYSFHTGLHSTIELVGLSPESQGLWVHGIEGYLHPDGETLSIFVISHRPRINRTEGADLGADSVIEIFEAQRGKSHAKLVRTVRNDLIVTPNNLVATGPRSFYVSNDHRRKVHWTRNLEMVHSEPSSIVHCDASRPEDHEDDCIVAIDGLKYPNGIARVPNSSTLFVASTMTGEITTYEIQADYTLFPLPAKITLNRPIDNIHVSPRTGALYASTFPKMLKFMNAASTGGLDRTKLNDNPVEIWKIEEEKGEGRFYGHQYKTSLLLSDPKNDVVSSITTAAPFEDRLLLTGELFSSDPVSAKLTVLKLTQLGSSAGYFTEHVVLSPEPPKWSSVDHQVGPDITISTKPRRVLRAVWPGFQVIEVFSAVAEQQDPDAASSPGQGTCFDLLQLYFLDVYSSASPPVLDFDWDRKDWKRLERGINNDTRAGIFLEQALSFVRRTNLAYASALSRQAEAWAIKHMGQYDSSLLPDGQIALRILRVWARFRNAVSNQRDSLSWSIPTVTFPASSSAAPSAHKTSREGAPRIRAGGISQLSCFQGGTRDPGNAKPNVLRKDPRRRRM